MVKHAAQSVGVEGQIQLFNVEDARLPGIEQLFRDAHGIAYADPKPDVKLAYDIEPQERVVRDAAGNSLSSRNSTVDHEQRQ